MLWRLKYENVLRIVTDIDWTEYIWLPLPIRRFSVDRKWLKDIQNCIKPMSPSLQTWSSKLVRFWPKKISGNVLSFRRCSLDPVRAEKLIKSAFRHRCKLRLDKKPPKIPSFRILEDEDVEEAEDEDHVRERQEIEDVAWAAFFDDVVVWRRAISS